MAKSKTPPAATPSPVVAALQQALADSYALMALSHAAHWNVEGTDFFPLHEAFEKHYDELFAAVDELAERLRALEAYAPGGLVGLARQAGFADLPATGNARTLVVALVAAHEKTVADLVTLRDLAGQNGDPQTEDLAIGRLQAHEKTLWMLRSYLRS
jgi:starvation-inducible DNA-binding protein